MSKISLISRVLDHFYPAPPIPLNHFDNFTLLVSVVLSAQTTDGKVNEVTKKLFEVAPTPQLMCAMDASEIQRIIQPVGLAPKKSVYLKNLSQKIVDDFNGDVPSTYENLESLAGVGHKTASVVMSQAFGESALAVDTHVHRLSLRWGLSDDAKNVDKVQAHLHQLFPQEHWNKVHLQMIYFGREYCTAKLHTPKECPICSWVNKKDGQPAVSFVDFTPKKKSKGIVFYEDRMIELEESPHLARGAVLLTDVKVKAESPSSSLIGDLLSPLKKEKKTRKTKASIITPDVKVKAEIEVEDSAISESYSNSNSKSKSKSKGKGKKRIEMEESKALDFSSPVAVKKKRTAPAVRSLLLTPAPVACTATPFAEAGVAGAADTAADCMVSAVCTPALESKELFKEEECPALCAALLPATAHVEMLDRISTVVEAIVSTADKTVIECKLETAAAVPAANTVRVKVKVEKGESRGPSIAHTRSRSKRKSIE